MTSAQVREREEEKMVRDSRSKSKEQREQDSKKFQKGSFIREKGRKEIGRIVNRYRDESGFEVIDYEFPQSDGALMVVDSASTFLELVSPKEVLTSRTFETKQTAEDAIKRYETVEFWRDLCGVDTIEIGRIKRVVVGELETKLVEIGMQGITFRCLSVIVSMTDGYKLGFQEVR